jgi:putative ABC transport system permease protein
MNSTRWLLFKRLILRPLASEPIRTALTVFAVALGVAVVIAIDIAGQAAAGSFHSSLEALTGKSDLLITATGGLDENILGKLTQLPYAFEFTPRIEDFASIDGKGEALPFIGVNLIGSSLMELNRARIPSDVFSAPNPVWIGRRFGYKVGAHLQLLINDTLRDFTVAGVLPALPGDASEPDVIVADIGVAQTVTGKLGKLDAIAVQSPAGESPEHWQQLLQRQLPASVTVEPSGARTDENRKMLSAFRWNLRVLSYIALVVGAFLIYNTISVSVVRRRNEIGVLRALGASRALILSGFLAEAGFFAVAGSALGVVLGRLMAIGAVKLVGNTVEALYVSSRPGPVQLTPEAVLLGVGAGLGVSVLAALAPALEASRIAPVEAMARGRGEYVAAQRSRRTIWWAILALALAAVASTLPPIHRQPLFAYLAVVLLVGGTAAAIPNMVEAAAAVSSRFMERFFAVEVLLAMRSLRGSLGRTSVLTAALTTAIAMTASVGIMVGSFRETLSLWMDSQLKADFYLKPAGSPGADRHPIMSAAVADGLERLPGVRSVDRLRAYPIFYQGLPATFAGGESTKVDPTGIQFLPGENRAGILQKLPTGDFAVVSEPFANKHNVHAGDTVSLPLAGANRSFQVLGIYYDYSTERGFIIVDRATLLKYLPDADASSVAVYVAPGTNLEDLRQRIGSVIAGRAVTVSANGALRRMAIAIFDRTFRITYALEAVAIVVAVMGIAGALLAMVIDRRREFALLRFLGGAQPQIRRIILCEAGLLGILSNGIGIVLGTLLSLILIFVINKQSFGWTIQFHWPVTVLLTALTGIYLATVLAALYPGQVAVRMNPIEVIHEE